jgi:DNA-directed RNA polymerase II subunit RPB1
MLKYHITDKPPVRPTKLRFGILSAKEVEEMSVCEVIDTTLYYRGLPASGGLLDPLMGSVDRRHLCATCMRDAKSCQGHSGHIQLPFPCYHIGFIETVLKTLRMTCFFCGRVCATSEDALVVTDTQSKNRFQAWHTLLRCRKTCPHCQMFRPTYQRTSLGIRIEWPADASWDDDDEENYCKLHFTARDALSILHSIPLEDIELIGLDPEHSHPANMILQNIVVPPPCTRPAIYSSEGSRSRGQNELTVRLMEVLKRSHEVRSFMDETSWYAITITPDFLERLHRLQYEIFMLVNSNARIPKPAGMGRNGGNTQIKSLTDRLKGKEGRIRGNLMGKRVDFSARCVITPDAYFDCDRVGVPYKIAMNLTIPEIVNSFNIKPLSERVKRGANDIHGADCVISGNGSIISLANCKDRTKIVLKFGDIVERFLADDDIVVFNRQPSLHMHGMQAHRVRLMPGHTFRLSLVVAAPYNADFDGDEMNLHVPQSKVASAECAMLMGVAQNCVSSQANKPVMGIVQDSLLGLHLLSMNGVLFDYPHTCRLIGTLLNCKRKLPIPSIIVRKGGKVRLQLWTGKTIFSMLLPEDLFVETNNIDNEIEWKDDTLPVIIQDGSLCCGVLSKAHVGTSAGGIVDILCREYNGVACMRFMGDAQRLTHAFLLQKGHHVGIDDVMLSRDGHSRVNERMTKATILCEEIQKEIIDAPPNIAIIAEGAILRLLSKMLLQTGGIVNEYMGEHNAIRRMVNAGSKGSFINLSQICACLGQQSLEGSRIVAEKGQRTLPFFSNDDLTLASRGMVFNSFALGLSPTELFYHAIGGREGLVDTAVKTSQTGYLQRRMNKSMEDHTVHMDRTIQNAVGDVISFTWGSDGMHPSKLERVRVPLLTDPVQSLKKLFTQRELFIALEARNAILLTKTNVLSTDVDVRILLPFHSERIKRFMKRNVCVNEDKVDVEVVWNKMQALLKNACKAISLALVDIFCEANVKHLSQKTFDYLFDKVETSILAAQNTQGESVGCIAAQSIGEPATQMTLNTFHLAGCAAKNVTLGIPRLKELLDASRSAKTPCTTLRFYKPYSTSTEFAEYFANTLPLTRLGDIVFDTKIVLQSETESKDNAYDDWMVHVENILGLTNSTENHSKYVIRMELHQEIMKSRQLTPPMIRMILTERLRGRAVVTSTEVNSVEWIVRIRFAHVKRMVEIGDLAEDQEIILCHRAANILMETVVVCGHSNVSSASASELNVLDSISVSSTQELVVYAYGNFLTDCVSSQCVDWTRCTSNDIWEVYHALGIEACCHVFFDQLKAVVSFDGTYVDDRHLILIVDTVCRMGTLMPLNRHGINRTDSSPLMRASFEETTDILCDAAIFAEGENGKGVTTSIMTGQLAEMGTGGVDVLFPDKIIGNNRSTLCRKGRVLRSTCRSHVCDDVPEVVEYIIDDVTPSLTRPLSPPTVDGNARKRARFRPMSPER